MTLEPLLSAPFIIQFHVATVLLAAALGAILLLCRKGTRMHRLFGRIWMGLMVATALSTFFIHTINQFHGFSLLHLLSIATLIGCYQAVSAARRGDIASHRSTVRTIYVAGIVIAGGFTLLPGRLMHAVFFSGGSGGARWVVGFLVGLAVALLLAVRTGTANGPSGKPHA